MIETADETELLLTFARHREVECPRCGGSLAGLGRPSCPRCGEPLRLTIGTKRNVRLWFIVAVAPGLLAGLCAIVLCIALCIAMLILRPAPWQLWTLDSIGFISGAIAVLLLGFREWFTRRPPAAQMIVAILLWIAHFIAFFWLVWRYID